MLKPIFPNVFFIKIFSVKKNLKVFLFLSLPFLTQLYCCTTEPQLEPNLKLELEDVSCTEAWLQLTTNNIQLPATINLYKNNSVSHIYNLNTKDSLLYIDSLLPNQTYKLKVSSIQNPVSSNELSVSTMDTTSHNITWQTFTFGENGIGSSTFYDVAIINENDIWVVGEIYMNDSLGNPDSQRYNAVHWNGQTWELKRIQTLFRGNIITVALEGIFAFSKTDIWMVGSLPIHGDGNNWAMYDLRTTVDPNLSLSKAWGSSSNDIYFVGRTGSIIHYQNGNWKKIESETNIDIKDVYGIPNGNEIWTCGWNFQTGQSMILKVAQSTSEIIWDSEIPDPKFIYSGLINGVCSNGNSEFVFVGGQVYRQSLLDGRLARREWVKTTNGSKVLELGNYGYRIKSSKKNNIAVVGDAAMIWHYNGATWYKFTELYNEEDRLYGLAITDNLIVAVGKRYATGTLGLGLIIIGRR